LGTSLHFIMNTI